MNTKISTVKNQAKQSTIHVEALADSGASASILSLDLAKKLKMTHMGGERLWWKRSMESKTEKKC